ncbi:hypothetical protein PoB_000196700, partial [Plakobranchus ocellatus]
MVGLGYNVTTRGAFNTTLCPRSPKNFHVVPDRRPFNKTCPLLPSVNTFLAKSGLLGAYVMGVLEDYVIVT